MSLHPKHGLISCSLQEVLKVQYIIQLHTIHKVTTTPDIQGSFQRSFVRVEL